MKLKTVTIPKLIRCARCGHTHEKLTFVPLTRPVEFPGTVGGAMFTYWAACPTNGEPIVMKVST